MRLIVDNLLSLGGRLRLGTKVERILVDNGAATGVQLAGGETIAADWVISAADGHATIYDLLDGRYTDKVTDKIYCTLKTFPSYLQVSLGIARDLSQQAGYVMSSSTLRSWWILAPSFGRSRSASFTSIRHSRRPKRPRSSAFFRRITSSSGLICGNATRRNIMRKNIASPKRSLPSWKGAWLISARPSR